MECFHCKGKMKKGETSYTVNRKDYHLVLDHVPAFICEQCGEPYFEENGIELVQQIIRDIDRNSGQLRAVG